MAYSAQTFTAGEQPTTTKWNLLWSNDASMNDGTGIANMAVNTTSISNPYKFSAYRNAAYNYTSGSAFLFDTKLFDTNTNYSTSTGKYTAPVNGFYFFSASLYYNISGNANTGFYCQLNKNAGAVWISGYVNMFTSSYFTTASVSGLLQLSAGDYVTIYGGSLATSSMGVGSSVPYCNFNGFLVSQT